MRKSFLDIVRDQRETEQRAEEERREWEAARKRSEARRKPAAAPLDAIRIQKLDSEGANGVGRSAGAQERVRRDCRRRREEHSARQRQRMGAAAGRLLDRNLGYVLGWSPSDE